MGIKPDMPDLDAISSEAPNLDKDDDPYQKKIDTIEDKIIELDEEIRAPNKPKAFFCKTCSKGFRFEENLEKHMTCHITGSLIPQQLEEQIIELDEEIRAPNKPKAFFCQTCNKGFRFHDNLQKHMTCHITGSIIPQQQQGPEEPMDEVVQEDPPTVAGENATTHPEPVKPSLFKRPSLLLKKNEEPNPNQVCQKCGKSFASQRNRNRHAKTCDGVLKVNGVPVASATAGASASNEQSPMSLVQEELKSEPQEPTNPADNLTKQGKDHSLPANFNCKTCKRTFRWKSEFERHEMTHFRGKAAFNCACGKNFGTEKHFRGHERNCGMPEEVRTWAQGCTYSCQKCTAFTTKSKDLFKGHLKDGHNMTVNDYRNEFESVVTHGKFHVCLICDTKVVHDEKYLDRHMKGHDINLKTYYNDKIMGGAPSGEDNAAEKEQDHEMEVECKTCEDKPSFANLEHFAVHLEAKHEGMSVKKYNKTVSNPFKNVEICQCKMCPAILLSEACLVKHLTNNHNLNDMSIEDYNAMK